MPLFGLEHVERYQATDGEEGVEKLEERSGRPVIRLRVALDQAIRIVHRR